MTDVLTWSRWDWAVWGWNHPWSLLITPTVLAALYAIAKLRKR